MTRDNTPQKYEIEIPVKPQDIDLLGHVSNVVYLRWVQEAAIAHWFSLASDDDKKNLLWVVVRHEIDYKRQAFENDEIIARTWVGGASDRAFERHTEILRKSDMKLLAQARTVWCPIDAGTRKPKKPSPEVYKRFSTHKSDTV